MRPKLSLYIMYPRGRYGMDNLEALLTTIKDEKKIIQTLSKQKRPQCEKMAMTRE